MIDILIESLEQAPIVDLLLKVHPFTTVAMASVIVRKLWGQPGKFMKSRTDQGLGRAFEHAWICSIAGQMLRAVPRITVVSEVLKTKTITATRFDDILPQNLIEDLWKQFGDGNVLTIIRHDRCAIFYKDVEASFEMNAVVNAITSSIDEGDTIVKVPYPVRTLPDLNQVREALPFRCYLAVAGRDETSTSILVVPE
jgi:hypothetical protein